MLFRYDNACTDVIVPVIGIAISVFGLVLDAIAGLGLMNTVLCILYVKIKKPQYIVFLVVSLLCSLCMGYLSSQNFAEAAMNWIAEGVNIIGQAALLIGAVLCHKSGLDTLRLSKKKENA